MDVTKKIDNINLKKTIRKSCYIMWPTRYYQMQQKIIQFIWEWKTGSNIYLFFFFRMKIHIFMCRWKKNIISMFIAYGIGYYWMNVGCGFEAEEFESKILNQRKNKKKRHRSSFCREKKLDHFHWKNINLQFNKIFH